MPAELKCSCFLNIEEIEPFVEGVDFLPILVRPIQFFRFLGGRYCNF